MTYLPDPFSDPDYVRDSLQDDLLTDPVPCALCGGINPPATRIVVLPVEQIRFGPLTAVRGICGLCFERRTTSLRTAMADRR